MSESNVPLAGAGHAVLTPHPVIDPPSAAELRVLMITCEWPTDADPAQSPFVKRQAEFLRAAGLQIDVLQFRGRRNPFRYASTWWNVRRRLARHSYHLIHAQHGQSGLVALPKTLPLVTTLRGSDIQGVWMRPTGPPTWTGSLLKSVSRTVARQSDAVIVVGRHMQQLLDTNVPTHVIPSGIDLQLFRCMPQAEARRRIGLDPHARLILFAGNPHEARKRFTLAQQAVGQLQRSDDTRLIVAWNQPHALMPYFMNACDAMVFTSAQEGSPNVVKEALACDLPVVSVSVGDVEELLSRAGGCELVGEARPEPIAAALERVLARGTRADGRQAVCMLDERLLTQKVIDVYRSVLDLRERPRAVESNGH